MYPRIPPESLNSFTYMPVNDQMVVYDPSRDGYGFLSRHATTEYTKRGRFHRVYWVPSSIVADYTELPRFTRVSVNRHMTDEMWGVARAHHILNSK
jgi:hypothetical protein